MKIIYLGPLRVGSSESPPLNVSAPVNVPLNKIDNDVLAELLSLGCGRPEAEAALRKAKAAGPPAEFKPLFRRALELVR
jgi:Holliday junction DNA helicase RuvA